MIGWFLFLGHFLTFNSQKSGKAKKKKKKKKEKKKNQKVANGLFISWVKSEKIAVLPFKPFLVAREPRRSGARGVGMSDSLMPN